MDSGTTASILLSIECSIRTGSGAMVWRWTIWHNYYLSTFRLSIYQTGANNLHGIFTKRIFTTHSTVARGTLLFVKHTHLSLHIVRTWYTMLVVKEKHISQHMNRVNIYQSLASRRTPPHPPPFSIPHKYSVFACHRLGVWELRACLWYMRTSSMIKQKGI